MISFFFNFIFIFIYYYYFFIFLLCGQASTRCQTDWVQVNECSIQNRDKIGVQRTQRIGAFLHKEGIIEVLIKEGTRGVRAIKMDSAGQVQFLDETVCISLHFNDFEIGK